MLEPPSPESCEISLESGAPPPGSSPAKPHPSPGPLVPPVGMPDPKPTSDNPASSEGSRRTIGEWFRTGLTKRNHNRTPRQTLSEAPPQSGIPSQTKATPPNEKPSTMSPAQRVKVSVPFSVDTGHGYLTTRLSGRSESPLLNHRLVHASYAIMDVNTYRASQKKAVPKPTVSNQLPKTNMPPEAGPAHVPDETKAESSGAKNNEEVRVHFVRLAAHNSSCSEELGDYHRTISRFHFPFQCLYPHGFVAAVPDNSGGTN